MHDLRPIKQAPRIPSIKSLTITFSPPIFHHVSGLFKSLIKHPEAFPHLSELRLPFKIDDRYNSSRDPVGVYGLDESIRDFLVLREGKISHLTIPPFPENNVTESLKKHVPYLKVRDLISCRHPSLIPSQIHQD